MSYDRDFNKDLELKMDAEIGQKRIKDNALFVKYLDKEGHREWHILFLTKYGERTCIFTPHDDKWKALKGKASGVGWKKMISYFRPYLPSK